MAYCRYTVVKKRRYYLLIYETNPGSILAMLFGLSTVTLKFDSWDKVLESIKDLHNIRYCTYKRVKKL